MLHHGIESEKSTNGRANIIRGTISGLCRVAPGPAAVLGERLFITPPPTRRLAMRFHFDWDASEPLAIAPRMEMPLLVVHDENDRFVPHVEGVCLADGWPGAELVTTTGLGHHRLLRDPMVVGRVTDFAHRPVPARARATNNALRQNEEAP